MSQTSTKTVQNNDRSEAVYKEAVKYLPGGVNSPVRAFNAVGGTPVFAKKGKGSKLTDIDGNTYIDYVCSWGPLIMGHSSDVALDGVMEVMQSGSTFGMPTAIEVDVAKLITEAVPAIEMVRMVSSGTEATMSALRLARAYTGRDKIIKFQGCYHGHSDGLLIKSGSGTLSNNVPTSDGVPANIIKDTLVAEFNDMSSVTSLVEANDGQVAAVIIEPIPGNMGLVEAKEGFLQALRDYTKEKGILLIFDEVISGFRIGLGGAGERYGITPDLVCLGKIIGGGMPVGAYGGSSEIMSMIAPLGGVYQAGTLSGNPVAMKMGLNVLSHLKDNPGIYTYLEDLAKKLEAGFKKNLTELGMKAVTVSRVGGMVCQFFCKGPVETYEQVMQSDTELYGRYFNAMLQMGVLLPPAQYECMFLSAAHTYEDVEKTIRCHYEAMKQIKTKS